MKKSMTRWLDGLSAIEPCHPGSCTDTGSEAASVNSTACEAYSPTNNYLLNRQMPVPHRSNFLRQQLELEFQTTDSDVSGIFPEAAPTVGGLLASVAVEEAASRLESITSVIESVNDPDVNGVDTRDPSAGVNEMPEGSPVLGPDIPNPSASGGEMSERSSDVIDREPGSVEVVAQSSSASEGEMPGGSSGVVGRNPVNAVVATLSTSEGDVSKGLIITSDQVPVNAEVTALISSSDGKGALPNSGEDVASTEDQYSDVEPSETAVEDPRSTVKRTVTDGIPIPQRPAPIIDLTNDIEAMDSGVDSEFLNPLPSPLTPLRTPVHTSMDNDEIVLELHRSPTPTLEEPYPTVKVSGKIRLPIRTPRDSKTDRKRESQSRIVKLSSGTSSGSRKENLKRPSDDEDNKVKKKAKESNASSASHRRTGHG